MSVDSILKTIEENPIQVVETLEDNDEDPLSPKTFSSAVPLLTRKEIIKEWLDGKPDKEIAAKYGLTVRSIKKIVDTNEQTRLELEKKYFVVAAARENYRISETKNNLLSYINEALESVKAEGEDMPAATKIKFLNNIAMIFDKIDNTSRLNSGKPTSLTEHRDMRVDVAEIMKQFRTPEDKLAFLQSQSNVLKKTFNDNVYEGESTQSTE